MSNRNNSAVLYRRSEKSSSIYIPTFVSFNKHLNYSKFSWAALSRVYYLKLINHDSENISIIICCITTFDLHVLVLMTKLFTVCVARVSWISQIWSNYVLTKWPSGWFFFLTMNNSLQSPRLNDDLYTK